MREWHIENWFKQEILKNNSLPAKCIIPEMAGMPDRLVLIPGGRIVFAELKAPGETLKPLQIYRVAQLRDMGFPAYAIDSKESIQQFIQEVFGK